MRKLDITVELHIPKGFVKTPRYVLPVFSITTCLGRCNVPGSADMARGGCIASNTQRDMKRRSPNETIRTEIVRHVARRGVEVTREEKVIIGKFMRLIARPLVTQSVLSEEEALEILKLIQRFEQSIEKYPEEK